MDKLHNCTLHRAVGNNILLECYTSLATSMFASFLILVYFDMIVAFGWLRGEDTTIKRANGPGKAPASSFYSKLLPCKCTYALSSLRDTHPVKVRFSVCVRSISNVSLAGCV